MSYLNWQKRSVLWTPDSYTANSVEAVFNVEVGDVVGLILCRTATVFNGSGTDAIFELGDSGDVDRFLDAGEIDETTAGDFVRAIGATGGGYILYRTHLYTAADTIDVNFTANTAGTRTTGAIEITAYIAKVRP